MRMSKPSSEYWADRLSRQNQRIGDKTIQEMEARLRQYYRAASADISREAEALYQKILADAENGEVRPNDLYRLDRMYHLQSKVHDRLQELGVLEIELLGNKLQKLAELVDNNTVSGLPDAAKNSPWAVLPREQAEAIVTRIWCADGENWSDRIWANKSALQHRLEKGLVDCIVRGVKNDVLAKTLMDAFGVGYREASRIARTETAHVQAEAEAAALEREGYDKYEFVNATDGRTCDECGKLNGKTFLMSERKAGVNFPPIHPNCRGRIVAATGTYDDGTEIHVVIRGPKPKERAAEKPVEKQRKSAIMQSSGKVGDTADGSTITGVSKIDVNDENAIQSSLDEFAKQYADAPIEHARVITPNGTVYDISGVDGAVNPAVVSKNELAGSQIIHNHPVPDGETVADSFSVYDFRFAAQYKTGRNYLATGEWRHSFEIIGDMSGKEAETLYKSCKEAVKDRAWETGISIEYEQLETMREIGKTGRVKFNEHG